MDDFLGILLVVIIYLFAASSRAGKKKGKQRGRERQRTSMRTRAQGEQRDVRAATRDRQTQEGFSSAFAQAQTAKKPAAEPERCDVQQMHLHEATQQRLSRAGEGEDPCHAGGRNAYDEMPFELQDTEQSDALAQDVLRGVIMSEILIRPRERAVLRRGGR